MTPPRLSMSGISKRFGATQALRDVSLDLNGGEVLALLGENGAGKSTLMKVLSGACPSDAGSMLLDGLPFSPRDPHAARQAGVAIVYQELTLAPDLNVVDNVLLGVERHRYGWIDRGAQRRTVREVLERLGHADLPLNVPVQRLSLAQQQLVEIARALVLDARVIVFDEPTSSLSQHDARRLFDVIGRLRDAGRGVIYISHFLEEVRTLADRYTVLRDGATVGHGRLAEVSERELVSQMVGRSVEALFPTTPHEPGETLLKVDRLSGRRLPRDVTFELRRGEIMGLAGLIGAGRTELLRALQGLDPVRQGSVRVAQFVVPRGVPSRLRAGLGLVSEDRKSEGLALGLSIADNLTLSHLAPYARWGWLNLAARGRGVARALAPLQLKARSQDQAVGELSGGNQQKVALARLLHQDAEVLLLDEPTRGIDVGTKAEIYRLLGHLAAEGRAVLFVSSYLPELLAVCDRVGVVARGRLCALRPAREWTEESILAVALSEGSESSTTGFSSRGGA